MKFAVIVVAYAGDELLKRSLESIAQQDISRDKLQVCVVANRPHPRCQERYADLVDIWEDTGENLGCSGGRNYGAQHTTAPILTFVDDDGVLDRDFFSSMERVLDDNPQAMVVRGRVKALHHPMVTQLAQVYDLGDEVRECTLDMEGATCIRREPFEQLGGYNVAIAYGEGMELQERLLNAFPDQSMLYNPGAVMRHDFAQGMLGLWRKGRAIAAAHDRPKLPTPASDRLHERLRQRYPRKRPSLLRRLYKAPAEIVFRLSQRYHRQSS